MVLILLTLCLLVAAGIGWLCLRDDRVAFLPARSGAEWILDDTAPQSSIHLAVPVWTVFKRDFKLEDQPANVRLSVCAFKTAAIRVNGEVVDILKSPGAHWKSGVTADITRLLKIGTNEIAVCVTNSGGPPALWLKLQAGQWSLGSDASWSTSYGDAAWQPARLAAIPPAIPAWSPLYDRQHTADSVRCVWPLMILFSALALALMAVTNRWLRGQTLRSNEAAQQGLTNVLLAVVIIVRAALFINNEIQLPTLAGFDQGAHVEYIQFIQEHSALPRPDQGWEMYQPPLYYASSAGLLAMRSLKADEADGEAALHTMNEVVGLVHCWLALLCLRLLFPGNFSAQRVGLLIAAFIPPHLYLSQYVTNEPLAGLWVTLALYFCLRALAAEKEEVRWYAGLGLALGAALLTKVSALLVAPFFFLAAGGRLVAQKKHAATHWMRSTGVMLLACLLVCGWYYGWIWVHFGRPIVGNWQSDAGNAWWQDPGFHTSGDLSGFGQSLVSPLFSGFHSCLDGIYSTLWGDGLISGNSQLMGRPPWNYDLMKAGYLLSLVPSLLAVIGLAVAMRKFSRQPGWEWPMVSGIVAAFALGIIYMVLQVASYAQEKAFYGFPALVPFSALIALGWTWVAQKGRILRTTVGVIVVAWAFTAATTFWIRENNFETWRSLACFQLQHQLPAESMASAGRALQLKPDDADSHRLMATALVQLNRPDEAIQQDEEALRLRPDYPDTLNDLAGLLFRVGKNDRARGIKLSERACQLTGYRQGSLLTTLATAYANTGQFKIAIATAQNACILAAQAGDAELLKFNQELIADCRRQPAAGR